jgi:hypothetical protein
MFHLNQSAISHQTSHKLISRIRENSDYRVETLYEKVQQLHWFFEENVCKDPAQIVFQVQNFEHAHDDDTWGSAECVFECISECGAVCVGDDSLVMWGVMVYTLILQ